MAESYPLTTKDWSFFLPAWAPYSRIGAKLNRLLQLTPQLANELWGKSLLKIAHNKNWPHCQTCQCNRPDESGLTELFLDEEDIIQLRVVNLQCDSSVNRALVSLHQPAPNPPCPDLPVRLVTYREPVEPPIVFRQETAVVCTPIADESEVGPRTGGVVHQHRERSKSRDTPRRRKRESPPRRRSRSRSPRDRQRKRHRSRRRRESKTPERRYRTRSSSCRRRNRRKSPIFSSSNQAVRLPYEASQALERINQNLIRLAVPAGQPPRNVSNPVNTGSFPSLSGFQYPLPKGIVPGDADVRLERERVNTSPVCLTARHKQREAKPAPLLLIKEEEVQEVIFPTGVLSPLEEEDFGHVVHIGISEEIVEYSGHEIEPEILEIGEELCSTSPAAGAEPDPPRGRQDQPGNLAQRLSFLAASVPEPVSPIVDSEAERREMLNILSNCKPN